MPCAPNPIPDPPSLGGGITIPPYPAPPTVTEPHACCQLVTFPPFPPLPPLPIPPAALAAAIAVLNAKLAILTAWEDSLPLKCPKSGVVVG